MPFTSIQIIKLPIADPGASEGIFLDFKNGVYTDAEGFTLFVTDILDENAFYRLGAEDEFDFAGHLVNGSGIVNNARGTIEGVALAAIVAAEGCTMIWEVNVPDIVSPGNLADLSIYDHPGFNQYLFTEIVTGSNGAYMEDTDGQIALMDGPSAVTPGVSKIGWIISPTLAALSVNGQAAQSKINPNIGTPNAVGFILGGFEGNPDFFIETIRILPAVTTAELPALTTP